MKTPKVPRGWRKLPNGSGIEYGDKFFSVKSDKFLYSMMAESEVGWEKSSNGKPLVYIRKIKRRKK